MRRLHRVGAVWSRRSRPPAPAQRLERDEPLDGVERQLLVPELAQAPLTVIAVDTADNASQPTSIIVVN